MEPTIKPTPPNILSFTQEALREKFAEKGFKSYIANQVLDWVYKKNVIDFNQMSNIAKPIREKLSQEFDIIFYKNVETLASDEGRAVKVIITLMDDKKIECVILKEKKYTTLCVSSQCGCPVDCKFCLTGVMGYKRNLNVHEIVGQIVLANTLMAEDRIGNLVFMGMGEPMLNYDNVFAAIDLINQPYGLHISKRRVTVSTSGYLQNIKRLISEKRYINLAFSVGHANPAKRAGLMPIENRNSIIEVAKLLHEYQLLHNRKLTLEYTLIEGKNEDEQAIGELANLSRFLNAKVNLINLNPHPKIPFKPISVKQLHQVRDTLKRLNVPVTIRFRKGDDISAACGQLGESTLNQTPSI